MSWLKKWTHWILLALLVCWLGSATIVAYHMTRRAQPIHPESTPEWNGIETPRLSTMDGQEIGAWLLDQEGEKASVLLLHGNRCKRSTNWELGKSLFAAGHGVLLITFRAHGDSTGKINDIGYGGRFDVLAGIEFLERRRPDRPIVVIGFSLGAAAATFASKELGTRVSGYVLNSPYPALTTVMKNRFKIYLPPVLDKIAWLGTQAVWPFILPHIDQIVPEVAVADIPQSVPVLFVVGEKDRRTTPEDVRRIYQRIASHAELIEFPNATHGQIFNLHPDIYMKAVLKLIAQAEKSATAN